MLYIVAVHLYSVVLLAVLLGAGCPECLLEVFISFTLTTSGRFQMNHSDTHF